jgi:hypothetical protein
MCEWTVVASAVGSVTGGVASLAAVFVIWWQLREMNRATIAQAFWPVAMFLQDDPVRKARRTLLSMDEPDFGKWTEAETSNAELACNAYDVVGILLKRTVIDHEMVTREWRISIINSWTRSEPIRKAYRQKYGIDHWGNFEWLYEKATILTGRT